MRRGSITETEREGRYTQKSTLWNDYYGLDIRRWEGSDEARTTYTIVRKV